LRAAHGRRGLDAAEELVNATKGDDVEMVVIGLRHRTAVGKFLLGSTSQQIILNAEMPRARREGITATRPTAPASSARPAGLHLNTNHA
jgi:hypothetical protein